MEPVRLAFVGVGGMGQAAHLTNYATMKECRVVALAELRPKLAQQVAQRYSVPKVYADWREMAAKEQFDAVVHINQFGYHGTMAPQIAELGKPMLMEKPLGNSVEAGNRIMAALKKTGTPCYLAYHKRSDPATMYARDLMDKWIAGGEMGPLRYVRLEMPPGDWIAGGFTQTIWSDERASGCENDPCPAGWSEPKFKEYVRLVNYYVHQVNLMRHLMGDYKVVHAEPSNVLMVVRNAAGVTGTIEMATHENSIAWQEIAFVAFERGWIRVELPAPLTVNQAGRVTVYRDAKGQSPELVQPTMPWVHAMRQQASNFLAAVRGEKTPLCPAADGLKDLQSIQDYLDLYIKAGGKL